MRPKYRDIPVHLLGYRVSALQSPVAARANLSRPGLTTRERCRRANKSCGNLQIQRNSTPSDRRNRIFLPATRACPEDGLMIFRQLFEQVSGTYSYLLASRPGGEALIIDPVLEKVDRYLQLARERDLRLVKAVDTHLHADHITGLGALREGSCRCR